MKRSDLPADVPAAYARSLLGRNTEKYMRARGWIDHRRVTRLADRHDLADALERLAQGAAPAKGGTS